MTDGFTPTRTEVSMVIRTKFKLSMMVVNKEVHVMASYNSHDHRVNVIAYIVALVRAVKH